MRQLREYQEKLIRDGAFKASLGHRRIILQAPTGAGKSVIFASLIKRYTDRNPDRKVLIACHREKLVKQSRKALYEWYNIIAEPVFADTKRLAPATVYTGMAETLHRRFTKNPNYIRNIGLLVIDECHLGLFNKFIELHPETLVIGFTATPLSASKKKPLNSVYHEIVCGPQINDLIAEKSLTMNITHRVKDSIDRRQLRTKNGEYDQDAAGRIMSSTKHVNNTVEAYRKFAGPEALQQVTRSGDDMMPATGIGRKTIIFNCNVAHSKIVTDAFNAAGYMCRHLDGYMPDQLQAETLRWFEETPDAILCNVAVATTGFDIPDIGCVIINKATKSLPLFTQMAGRGSRLAPGKKNFIIIDMGKNYLEHGDWSDDRDWADWFYNPEKPREGGGVAPVKDCPSCEAMIHASVRVCPFCGADCAAAPVYDDELVEFETIVQGKPLALNIPVLLANNAQSANGSGSKWRAVHQIKYAVIKQARMEWGVSQMTEAKAYKLLEVFQGKVQEWCKETKTRYDDWVKTNSADWFFAELKRVFNWEPQKLEIAI
jgi:superfamily II DNA or RNA helicase